MRELTLDHLDWAEWVRPGDLVTCGQGTGEPRTLTESLMQQRRRIGSFSFFLSTTYSETFHPSYADVVRFIGISAVANTRRLAAAGVLHYVPTALSVLPRLLQDGPLSPDVVLMQVSPPGPDGHLSFGLVNDYVSLALDHARVVIAEVNDQVPWTFSGAVDLDRVDVLIRTSRPPLEVPRASFGPIHRQLGEHVASLIPDGATLEVGVGAAPEAILHQLAHHRDLGVHSGLISDGIAALAEAGVVTNRRKALDPGIALGGVLFGTKRLYRLAAANPAWALRPLTYTHQPEVLAAQDQFIAINSALQVDLTGQINAEEADGQLVGAVGGQVDFARGALRARGGRSIVTLPSTAQHGAISRIVPRLDGPVTTPRSDADLVVTEHGVADLRGVPAADRAERLIAIADPRFREWLRHEAGS